MSVRLFHAIASAVVLGNRCDCCCDTEKKYKALLSRRSWDTVAFHRLRRGNAALFPQVCLALPDVSVRFFHAIVSAVVPGNT